MELKTNKEYQAMQKEMAVAEHDLYTPTKTSSSSTWSTPKRSPRS